MIKKGTKRPEHSKVMMGNTNAFKSRTITKLCEYCKKNSFTTFISHNRKYCSKECLLVFRRNQMLGNSLAVGNKLSDEHKIKISEFMIKTRQQENNPNWKGGRKRQHKILYGSRMYREWRKAVFTRDGFTCMDCGIKNESGINKTIVLQAHHIKEWCNYPELRFEISNGKTLCINCHNKTKYGKYTKII